MSLPVFKVKPTIQQYDWGKIGETSKVAQLASASETSGLVVESSKPYAELWMGTHVSSPSTININGSSQPLSDYLAKNPNLCGEHTIAKFPGAGKGNLPFLFKVLSIEKALSIQSHPDKKTAEVLHQKFPKIYKDDNHKPEMALALTPFQALCGFSPLKVIAKNIHDTPELAALIPKDILDRFISLANSDQPDEAGFKSALKDVFSAIMNLPESEFKPQLATLVKRYKSLAAPDIQSLQELVIRLDSQFPEDIGIFCAFLLNHITLNPGEAIFLAAGEPHAYIAGDIMECMANSDNVIRAGLTPKLRDVPNLVSGLRYTATEGSEHTVKPRPFSEKSGSISQLYDPPVPEFSVIQVDLKANGKETHRALTGPSLAIVTEGKGQLNWSDGKSLAALGDVIFIGAGTEVEFTTEEGIVLYRAFTEVN